MRSHELTLGRSFVVAFDDGDDFFTALAAFCDQHDVRQGFIPGFIAGFRRVEIVGTCTTIDNPEAPLWDSVHLTGVEALGGGTLAVDPTTDRVAPHIHVSVGLKAHSATAHTSHLLKASVQFLTEMLVVETTSPQMHRIRDHDLYDVPLLRFTPPDP